MLLYTGNPDASIQSTNESAAGFRVLGDAWGLGMALHDLGRVSLARKHNQPAYAQFQESVEMLRREGDTWMLCNALDGLGHATLAQGDLEGATVHFRDLFSLASAKGQTFFVILMIEGMACIACARGAFANGAELFGAADAFRELLGAPLAPFMRAVYEPFRAAAAAALGEGLLAGAETQGRALTPEQAIERALKTETSSIAYSTEHNP